MVVQSYSMYFAQIKTAYTFPSMSLNYDTAIAYNPRDGTYFFHRGYAKLAKGDRLGACDDWYIAGSLGYYADFQKIKEVCE